MMPTYATKGSAGADLYASCDADLWPGGRALIPVSGKDKNDVLTGKDVFGECFQVRNHAALIVPRSGLALKHGITVLNAPGLIDSDYTGEIGVILVNHSDNTYFIDKGDRIAQLVMIPVAYRVGWEIKSETRNGGFGSTGVNDD